jgi:hypothetical protein
MRGDESKLKRKGKGRGGRSEGAVGDDVATDREAHPGAIAEGVGGGDVTAEDVGSLRGEHDGHR